MKLHRLKTNSEYFLVVKNGKKRFEVREADRDFKVNDLLMLHQHSSGVMSEEAIGPYLISYILDDSFEGVSSGFCVLGFQAI